MEYSHSCWNGSRVVLAKFKVGEIDSVASLARYQAQGEEDRLYAELKEAVDEYFRESKVALIDPLSLLMGFIRSSHSLALQLDPRFSTAMYLKTAFILSAVMLSAALAFFGTQFYLVGSYSVLSTSVSS